MTWLRTCVDDLLGVSGLALFSLSVRSSLQARLSQPITGHHSGGKGLASPFGLLGLRIVISPEKLLDRPGFLTGIPGTFSRSFYVPLGLFFGLFDVSHVCG